MTPLLTRDHPVTIVGGGELSAETLDLALSHAPTLVAADGAATRALALGQMPDLVVGDFDSIDTDTRAAIPADRQHHIAEQDSTDFDKCLRHVAAPLVLGAGFMGGRIDHELAALNVLARHARPVLLIGPRDVVFMAPERLTLDLPEGTRVSLFPMAPVTGESTGLRWPIEGIDFAPSGRSGTSNAATGPVTLRFDARGMLMILPRRFLRLAMDALYTP